MVVTFSQCLFRDLSHIRRKNYKHYNRKENLMYSPKRRKDVQSLRANVSNHQTTRGEPQKIDFAQTL